MKMKAYTKKEAIKIIVECAQRFHDALDGHSLLFMCADKHGKISAVEVIFDGSRFLHLTGVRVRRPDLRQQQQNSDGESTEYITARDFYQKCLSHKLSPNDFEFADDGTTHLKLNVLPGIMNGNLSANMIGDYNSSKPKLYTEKLAGGVHACIGFVLQEGLGFVPNTVLSEDVRQFIGEQKRIIATYRKAVSDERYTEMTYKAKKYDWSRVQYPEEYSYIPLPT